MNYPADMTPAIREVLGQPCFKFIQVAILWRLTGDVIGRRAEEEQAFFIHLHLKLALEHGDAWRERFADLVQERIDRAKAQRAAENATPDGRPQL